MTRRGSVEALRAGQGRPADACPYARPFPADFHDCPTYHPAWFTALTTGYDPLTPVWTCSNLVPSALPSMAARFYGRCRIGDEAARLAWAGSQHARRLAALRELSRDLTADTTALSTELMTAKGVQLQAAGDEDEHRRATVRLEEIAAVWMTHLDTFLCRHGSQLESLGFPPGAVRTLCVDLIADWIAQDHAGPPEVSDEALRPFPEDVRILLRPDAGEGAQ